jgi:hypothetical protein
MKTFTTIVAAMAFVLAFGLAYADDMTIVLRDVGTELYDSAFRVDHAAEVSHFAAGPRPTEVNFEGLTEAKIEIGSVLYDSAFAKDDIMLGETEAKGSAAGGMAVIDRNTEIWEKTLAVPGGGSDQL